MQPPLAFNPINKVLLVDDDAAANYLSKELLERLHAANNIEVAENCIRALTMVKRSNPDVIFLDIRMPGADGFDFLERLKSLALEKKIKVVMLTSSLRPEEKLKAFSYKAVIEYLEKPLTVEKVQRLATYLN
jgi:CheY-like chemotaxis protein